MNSQRYLAVAEMAAQLLDESLLEVETRRLERLIADRGAPPRADERARTSRDLAGAPNEEP